MPLWAQMSLFTRWLKKELGANNRTALVLCRCFWSNLKRVNRLPFQVVIDPHNSLVLLEI